MCGFDHYFCFTDFMIRFIEYAMYQTYILCSHDTLQTLKYGQDCVSTCSNIHVWDRPIILLHESIVRFTDLVLFLSLCIGYANSYIWA